LTITFAHGARLGAYEIGGPLGAGGMGEVYRATDTQLKRDVAIKVLPPSFAEDADRLARFQREAEVLAALNHPNIAHIYGLERSEGTAALVMELVEGPTLADRIAQGPIPPDEALHIALQIAEALEAAHTRNIVHRDLKPANIKVTPEGIVKVLDFGIAKAIETQAGASGPQKPSLTTPAMTQAGILLGTAAYMAPEQARGKAVDQRADVWAYGCVLYEMLTGQPAFGGEDVPMTLARVLANDTDLKSMSGAIPPAVRHTIKLCLEKDVRKRIADIRDAKLALQGAFETGSIATVAEAAAAGSYGAGAGPLPSEDAVPRRNHAHRLGAPGLHRAPCGAGATAAGALDEIPWSVRGTRGVTRGDHAGGTRAGGAEARRHPRAADAEGHSHELGAPPEARIWDRDRAVRALRWEAKGNREH
jgi:hypothetical protein